MKLIRAQPFIHDITYSVNLSLNILLDCNSIRLNKLSSSSNAQWIQVAELFR